MLAKEKIRAPQTSATSMPVEPPIGHLFQALTASSIVDGGDYVGLESTSRPPLPRGGVGIARWVPSPLWPSRRAAHVTEDTPLRPPVDGTQAGRPP